MKKTLQLIALFGCMLPGFYTTALANEPPAKYQSSCFACHGTGAAGAPKTGDTKAWASRIAQGKEAMLTSVKKGKGAMPPGGLCADCSDEEHVALIEYMAQQKFEK